MAHSQQTSSSPYIEIQNLKESLDTAHKTIDRYAHLIAKLSTELDDLRSNICYTCKKKLAPGNASAPISVLSSSLHSSSTTGVAPSSFWRRMLDGLQHRPQSLLRAATSSSDSPAIAPQITLAVPPGPAATSNLSHVGTNSSSDEQISISSKVPRVPEWSVVYNPEVKQVLDLRIAHIFKYKYPILCVKMSPDGQRVAIGCEDDGKTYIKEVKTGATVCVLVDLYLKDRLDICFVDFSPDGQLLATAASDGGIRIWKIAQKRVLAKFKGHTSTVNSVAFSLDGHSLVSTSDGRSVRIWNLRDGSSKKPTDDHRFFLSAAFSPDGRYIAAGNLGDTLRIWDARTDKLVARWNAYNGWVWCVKFTPDGKGLMSGGKDNLVHYWDVSSLGNHEVRLGKEQVNIGHIRSFSCHTNDVRSIAFFPRNRQWFLSSSYDGTVRLWDSETGDLQLTLEGHIHSVQSVDVSSTEKFLATASRDGHVTVWECGVL